MAWSPNGDRLATTTFLPPEGREGITDIGFTYVYSPSSRELRQLAGAPLLSTDGLAWSPGNAVLAVSERSDVAIMGAEHGQRNLTMSSKRLEAATPVSISWQDDIAVAFAYADGMWIEIFRNFKYLRDISVPKGLPSQIESIGWSPDGSMLAALLSDNHDSLALAVWLSDKLSPAATIDLGHAWCVRPVLSQAWSPESNRIALSLQPVTAAEESDDQRSGDLADHVELIVWDPARPDHLDRRLFELGPFGMFGAVWSPDERWISCTTGREILLLDPESLKVRDTLDSFFAEERPEPIESVKRESEDVLLSGLGFTVRHTWSPDGAWLVAGNVGGLRWWRGGRTVGSPA